MKRLATFSWMRSDLSLKIASLVLALFLWLYVRGEEKPVQVFSLPLEVEGLPGELMVTGESPDSVEVRVRGPRSTLQNLSPGRFHARLDLEGAGPGEVMVPLAAGDIRAPLGVEVVGVAPDSVTLRIERRITREVPVVPRFTGRPAPGYEQDGYTLSPDRVVLEGPERIVTLARQAVTSEVDLSGRSGGFETSVRIVPETGGARVVGGSAGLLRVNVRRQRITRSFPSVRLTPALPAGVSHRLVIQPETVVVVLEGTEPDLSVLEAEEIRAVLDLEGMSPREAPYIVKPRIVIAPADLAARIVVHSVSEPTVSVTIRK